MGFKKDLDREKNALLSGKRPYETAAFLVFSILFIQQISVFALRIFRFIKDSAGAATGWFSFGGMTTPVFVSRIIGLDNTSFMYLYVAIAALALWYFLIYLLVWKYCKDHNKAKWTWTLLIVFGPAILFMPPYIFYAIYVFRNYFFRFVKIIVEEYKAFDPKEMAAMEAKLLAEEDDEAEAREAEEVKKAYAKKMENEAKEKAKQAEQAEQAEKEEEKVEIEEEIEEEIE